MGTSWGRVGQLMRGFVVVASAVTALLALLGPAGASAAISSNRSGPTATATRIGPAPGSTRIELALPLRADAAGLQRFATAVSTPGSPQYGAYESIATLAHRFGASAADRARVVHFLRAAGATGVRIDVTGMFADATVTAGLADRLFGASLTVFRQAGAARYVAPGTAPRLPAALRGVVTGVVGLNTRPLAVAHTARSGAWPNHPALAASGGGERTDQSSGYLDRTGTAQGCTAATSQTGFTPNQYLAAYNFAPLEQTGLEGQGERVALIEIDGFKFSDLRTYANCFGLSLPSIEGFGIGLRHPLSPGGESTLDIEVLDSVAPKLKAIDVYESSPSAVAVLRSLTAPLTNRGHKPDVISASLGACESDTIDAIGSDGLRAAESSLALAAASGISIVASSGDDGSSGCVDNSGGPLPELAVSYPASSPWVTGVGGTNVTLDPNNVITQQVVWNDAPISLGAAGGGLSSLFRRPSYQNGFLGAGHRGVPDVSMLADPAPGYEIFCSAQGDCINGGNSTPWTQVGGTSAAAPLLAGGLALVDQDLRAHGRQDIGLANPLLYKAASSSSAASVISDVTSGDNDLGAEITGQPLGCCSAQSGYDEASGLGSVNLSGFAQVALATVPQIVQVGLTVPRQPRPVAHQHLLAHVSCSGACLLGAYTSIQIGHQHKPLVIFSGVFLLRHQGARTIKIPFRKKALKRLRTALANNTKVTATIFGAVLDPGGNIESRTPGRQLRISH